MFKLVTFGVLLLGVFGHVMAQGGLPAQPYIQVTGYGVVIAEPDIAVVRVGISVSDDSSAIAQAETNGRFDDLRGMLNALGINNNDIVAASIVVYQRYNMNGFTASRDVTVTVRDVEQVDEVLNAATTAGVTNVSGITFSSSNQRQLLQQARENAIEDSRTKAQELAASYGSTLGAIWRVTYNGTRQGGTFSSVTTGGPPSSPGGFSGLPGDLQISDDVNVIYLLGSAGDNQ